MSSLLSVHFFLKARAYSLSCTTCRASAPTRWASLVVKACADEGPYDVCPLSPGRLASWFNVRGGHWSLRDRRYSQPPRTSFAWSVSYGSSTPSSALEGLLGRSPADAPTSTGGLAAVWDDSYAYVSPSNRVIVPLWCRGLQPNGLRLLTRSELSDGSHTVSGEIPRRRPDFGGGARFNGSSCAALQIPQPSRNAASA